MIEQWSEDRTGWAKFSDDMVMRYRLARSFTPFSPDVERLNGSPRVAFLMLNPSNADAFKPDPTVGECIKRARKLGADVLEVVNLFAFRSAYPVDLKKRAHGHRGDDRINDEEILAACMNAYVVAAWGNDGALDFRSMVVTQQLARHGVKLHHLGMTKDGHPKHPLARGVHRIPADLQPTVWEYA